MNDKSASKSSSHSTHPGVFVAIALMVIFVASAMSYAYSVKGGIRTPIGTHVSNEGETRTEDLKATLLAALPDLGTINSVTPSPVAGLYEVVFNDSDIIYMDGSGEHAISGSIIRLGDKKDLTQERVQALTAIDFDKLPLQDAFTVVRGDGSRKLAVFTDPNCPYCKRYEASLQEVDNVTVHMFLVPILGPDSLMKSQVMWCSGDVATSYLGWMLDGTVPAAPKECDTSALERNVAFARQHKITGTPTTFFADGQRSSGAIPAARVEEMLAGVSGGEKLPEGGR